jgi:outer membrane protein TolC
MVHRPEQLKTNYAAIAANSRLAVARSSMLPAISVRGAFEEDRQDFLTRGGPNWTGSVALTWNIFNGGGDKARIDEASQSLLGMEAERDRMRSSVRLDVRRAWENLRAADQQVDVSHTAVAEAVESLRITQNRYQVGLNTVTDLLRTESAVLDSRTQHLAALHDQHLAAIVLDAATGTLSVDSPALQE